MLIPIIIHFLLPVTPHQYFCQCACIVTVILHIIHIGLFFETSRFASSADTNKYSVNKTADFMQKPMTGSRLTDWCHSAKHIRTNWQLHIQHIRQTVRWQQPANGPNPQHCYYTAHPPLSICMMHFNNILGTAHGLFPSGYLPKLGATCCLLYTPPISFTYGLSSIPLTHSTQHSPYWEANRSIS